MNHVHIMGRITKDLELRYSKDNLALLTFTVAVNRMKKDETDFITCKAFGKTAENINNFFSKGRLIAIDGRIQTGSYEKDGQKIYTTDVMVSGFHFTGEKKSENSQETNEMFGSVSGVIVEDDGTLPF
jgi:single-strand DNA-binding protein